MSDGLFGASDRERDKDELSRPAPASAPLAERMRPRTLEEFVGQEHLVGAGKVLERALKGEATQSLILWGPPGTGKTTLARMIAARSGLRFVPFSAVLSGIKEIKEVMAQAEGERRRAGTRTLLFVDEFHRFNKAQQDAFLPYVERGDILLIGATTENPSFEINGALLSRMRTVILRPLAVDDVVRILERALTDAERGLRQDPRRRKPGAEPAGATSPRWTAAKQVLERIAHASDGDARRALTALETAAELLPNGGAIDEKIATEALQKK